MVVLFVIQSCKKTSLTMYTPIYIYMYIGIMYMSMQVA